MKTIGKHQKTQKMMLMVGTHTFKVNFTFAMSGVVPAGLQHMVN